MPTLLPALSKLIVLLCGACHVIGLPSALQTIDIPLKTGTFRGLVTPNGTDTFFGIPFARPPVGGLRFKAPVPITETSKAVKDASQFGNACPQPVLGIALGAPIGESCLFLNVGVHSRYMTYCPDSAFRFGGHQVPPSIQNCPSCSGYTSDRLK